MRRNCLGRVLRAIESITWIGLNAKEVELSTCIIIIRVLHCTDWIERKGSGTSNLYHYYTSFVSVMNERQ
jgi:hypothetical protein